MDRRQERVAETRVGSPNDAIYHTDTFARCQGCRNADESLLMPICCARSPRSCRETPKMHASRFSAARVRACAVLRRGRYKTNNATRIASIRARSPRSASDRPMSIADLSRPFLRDRTPSNYRDSDLRISLSLSLSFSLFLSSSREFNSLATPIIVFIISVITRT